MVDEIVICYSSSNLDTILDEIVNLRVESLSKSMFLGGSKVLYWKQKLVAALSMIR